ncbi:putative RNA-binding protein Luc7-like 2 isoform X2 [Mizuhopecten yessoensis]|uniref:RNA-binding protein Luc7-like 2 n=1 Tax=Mizuhopecten yessoensis TaxID=6573 RepID=A0A210QGB4_MIZYE|nr:putative RNA-binding protein Luc7-like 2 isoform X2 [Mizuhopecten yessoensis]OWF47782.1 RNA-binding protein Luc7-like 2 [Mizuhopecten yessoensis]
MSAQDQMRAMLDELMGTSRNGDTAKYKVKFDDPRVCKSFLLACCPHDILSSTRMDLGECPKIHDLALRADYEWATKKKDYYYDIDAMEHLQSFIADCDRKTEMAKRRLKETQEELSEEANQKAEKIHALGEQLGENMAKAETMGGEGEVEESLKLMEEVEELKKNKSLAEQDYRNSMPASSYQQQKLRVCEVCSAYLGIHDNDRRLADHFGGKLHLGFITIREKLEELKTRVAERRNLREKEREEQKVKREKEEEARKSKSASPVRRRSRSTSKRSRSRSKSRKRSRSRSNSRDKNRRRRSRSSSRSRRRSTSRTNDRRSHKRSRHSRSRSKSRRSRSRGSRSRRSRSRRSRSRSRSRSRRHKRRSRSRSRRSRSRSKSRRHRHRSRSASASRRSRSAERDRRRDSRSKS